MRYLRNILKAIQKFFKGSEEVKKDYTIKFYKAKNKQWTWHLVAPNGRKIATSGETFSSKTKCTNSVGKLLEIVMENRIKVEDGSNS
jgi:uncharacterized protein YegP (UPF0339 family)